MIGLRAENACMTSTGSPITLRTATAADAPAIAHLAALDSRRPLSTEDLVVAERGEHLVAAVSVSTLDAIADPFVRTAADVTLLRQHAVARRNARPARRHFRLVPRAA
jgi:hypothetical protein